MDYDLVIDLVLILGLGFVAPIVCGCLFVCCLSHVENSRKDRNTDSPLVSMEDISQINTPMPSPGPVVTESTENITGRNTRRNAVIQLTDNIILTSYIIYDEETIPDPSHSSRIVRPRNYHQSVSVSLPPEIILTPSQHIINPECDSPPNYESLYPK